jgi:dUTP pyrophosphatase
MSSDTLNTIINAFSEVMVLKLYINSQDNTLYDLYLKQINNHNFKLLNTCNEPFESRIIDSGFDLYTPFYQNFTGTSVNTIDFKINCSAILYTLSGVKNTGYYIYPRSSLAKTDLRLANSVGIIDSGYRGNIMGLFDYVGDRLNTFRQVQGYDRIVQICSPTLGPIYIELVNSYVDLGMTERGNNGIGSTGFV